MIIWLASYPKSGNTWLRTIINELLYSKNNNEDYVFDALNNITKYPKPIHFKDISEKFTNTSVYQDKYEVIKNWIPTQSRLNLDNKIKFFKTHNCLCKINIENKDYSFTNIDNTAGVIHIVRDPRTILTSLKYHFHLKNYEEAFEMMTDRYTWTGLKKNNVPEVMSSWDDHYLSWSRFPKNYFLIKYEDLLKNPKQEIIKLSNYLNKFFKINLEDNKLNKIILNTSYENLKKQEKRGNFSENVIDIHTNQKKDFFNMGPNNIWQNLLDRSISEKVEKKFENIMKRLGYLI